MRLSVCLYVYVFVRAVKGKRLELSTSEPIDMADPQRVKGQRSGLQGYQVRSCRGSAVRYDCVLSVYIIRNFFAWMFKNGVK